jgi:hypothetical protein
MSQLTEALVTIFTAIIGVAILSVIVSSKSNTTGVLQAFGSMFSNALGVATSPVTGAQTNLDLSYPSGSAFNFGTGLSGGMPQFG